MITIQVKQKAKRRFIIKIVWGFLIFILLVLIKPTWIIWRKYLTSREELKKSEQEIEDLKLRQTRLESDIEDLETEVGMEREIVRKFDLVREGEKLAIIIEPEEEPPEEEIEKSFIKRFFDWIFTRR